MSEAKTNLTLKQRQRLQGTAKPEQKKKSGDEYMNAMGRRAAEKLVLLLAFLGGIALGMYSKPDPRLQEMDDMLAIATNELTPRDVRDDLLGQRGDLADEIPSLRGRGRMRDPEEREMAMAPKFLAKSSADQLAELEKQAARQKEWEAWQAEREAEAAAAAATKPATDSSQANNSSNSNGRGGRGGGTDQQRVQRQEQRLANHPPQLRAQGTLMHQMMNAVRQQQGLATR